MPDCAIPPQFDEAINKWPGYQVRLEVFFEGNRVTEKKRKHALLVAALSTNTVDVSNGHCAPDKGMHIRTAKLSHSCNSIFCQN